MNSIPSSVYHLLINEQLPLKKVREIIPYLDALGLEGIYCSPLFEAVTLHGYDIANPNRFNPKVCTIEEFEAFATELKSRHLKLLLDVVPNHMGIKGKKNEWWLDVLEAGPDSPFAEFFDIEWDPVKRELKNKVLLPILADSYGQVLLKQEIQLIWEMGSFWIHYYDYKLPLAHHTYSFVIEYNIEKEASLTQKETKEWLECLDISRDLKHEAKGKEVKKKRLDALYQKSHWIRERFAKILSFFNGVRGNHASFDPLHELLDQQFYRLAHWLVAGKEVNYRRFFNINELIAIHIEKEKVLNAHHRLVFDLVEDNIVQGLRIDHPDGLYDPSEYFDRLQKHKPSFVVIEKILDRDESLPPSWNVQGTVGYEFLNILNGLFIYKKNEPHFSKIYDKFIGRETDFDVLLYERKKWFIMTYMGSEVETLGWRLSQLTEESRYYRDFTRIDLTHALQEIIACFPVYRTYISKNEEASKRDKDYIFQAIATAKQKTPEISPSIYTYIRDLFLSDPKNATLLERDFIQRFQQQTAPVMAKGLEDSCFYIFNRFAALNEVGGNPRYFGISKLDFHQFNIEKLNNWPLGLLPSSTQDTKWSEDARLRLAVLSEIPKKWETHVLFWSKENQKYKKKIKGILFPDPNTEYFLYQLLISIYSEDSPIFDRLWGGFLKSMREAASFTCWSHPNAEYENAAKEFLTSLLNPQDDNLFYRSFIEFYREVDEYGRFNSLSSMILKMGSCGIVDIYQGNEFWNFCMMDPDNRRPVDFDYLKTALKDQKELKLWATGCALRFRRAHKELFLSGEYIPLISQKDQSENNIAFLRKKNHTVALIAAGRFFTELPNPPIGKECWGEAHLTLPKEIEAKEFKDIFTGKTIHARKKGNNHILNLADLFQDLPFAILTHDKQLF